MKDGTFHTQQITTDGAKIVKFGKVANNEMTNTPNSVMDEGKVGKLTVKGIAMHNNRNCRK